MHRYLVIVAVNFEFMNLCRAICTMFSVSLRAIYSCHSWILNELEDLTSLMLMCTWTVFRKYVNCISFDFEAHVFFLKKG